MVIEKGNSYESNMEAENDLSVQNDIEITDFNQNNNNHTKHKHSNNNSNNNEESSKSKRKEPAGEIKDEDSITKRRKTNIDHNIELVMDNVSHTRASGITLLQLQELHPEIDVEELQQALKTLQEKKRILQVDDQVQFRFVSNEYASKWCIIPTVLDEVTKQQKRDASKDPIVVRPWLTLTGEINQTVFNSFQTRLLFAIFKNPGICDKRLYDLLYIISPAAVDELLETLITEQKITFKTHISVSLPSLFSLFDVPWSNNSNSSHQQRIYYSTKIV